MCALDRAGHARTPFYIGATALKTAISCPRKWWYEYVEDTPRAPDTAAQKLGTEVHALVEHYLTPGDQVPPGLVTSDAAVALLAHLLPLLPDPADIVAVEHTTWPNDPGHVGDDKPPGDVDPAALWYVHGAPVRTTIDLVTAVAYPCVTDHKTTGAWKYSRTADDLPRDPQMVLYGAYVLDVMYPHATHVTLAQNQVLKPRGPARRVETTVSRADIFDALARLHPTIDIMRRAYHIPRAKDVPYDEGACFMYGRCPHYAKCPRGIDAVWDFEPQEDTDMSLWDLINNDAPAPAPAPVLDPDVVEACKLGGVDPVVYHATLDRVADPLAFTRRLVMMGLVDEWLGASERDPDAWARDMARRGGHRVPDTVRWPKAMSILAGDHPGLYPADVDPDQYPTPMLDRDPASLPEVKPKLALLLRDEGISTVGEMMAFHESKGLDSFPGIGAKTVERVVQAVQNGYQGEPAPAPAPAPAMNPNITHVWEHTPEYPGRPDDMVPLVLHSPRSGSVREYWVRVDDLRAALGL